MARIEWRSSRPSASIRCTVRVSGPAGTKVEKTCSRCGTGTGHVLATPAGRITSLFPGGPCRGTIRPEATMATQAGTSSNIYPSLTYDDAPAAIEWLCRAFGFEKRLVVPGPRGTVMHSELSVGPGVIMVSSPKPEADRIGPRGLPGVPQALSVRVDDPDAHFARAQA